MIPGTLALWTDIHAFAEQYPRTGTAAAFAIQDALVVQCAMGERHIISLADPEGTSPFPGAAGQW
jgi:hypothetical protein